MYHSANIYILINYKIDFFSEKLKARSQKYTCSFMNKTKSPTERFRNKQHKNVAGKM